MEYSQATIISAIVLYNISKDLGEEEPTLPDSMSTARFDRLMSRGFYNTPARLRDQNGYIRDQIVTKYYARQVQ